MHFLGEILLKYLNNEGFFWFLTDATTKSRPAPNKETLPIANTNTEFYCSRNIMAVPN